MNKRTNQEQTNKVSPAAQQESKLDSTQRSTFQFVDNRPEALEQRSLQEMANNSSRIQQLKAFQNIADKRTISHQSIINKNEVIQRVTHAELALNATRINNLNDIPSNKPLLTIAADHTGDMYQTKAAAAVIDGRVNILIIRVGATENTEKLRTANMMAEYFAGIGGTNIYYMNRNPPRRRMSNNEMNQFVLGNPPRQDRKLIDEGGATTLIMLAMRRADTQDEGAGGGTAYRDARLEDMAEGVAPIGNTGNYNNALTNQGYLNNHDEYIIVNFRQSGHGNGTHPELDTGRQGLKQIIIGVKAKFPNAKVVPMGEYDPFNAVANRRPNLINYWAWPHIGGRADQAGLIRHFKKNYNVKGAVGMRSGVMDSMALSGIPIVSIDINPVANNAGDIRDKTNHDAPHAPASEKKAKGWDRGMKLEEALGPSYGRAFIKDDRINESNGGNPWRGEFSRSDDDIIRNAVSNILGDNPTRDSSHPLGQVELNNSIVALENAHNPGPLTDGQRRVRDRLLDILENRDYTGVEDAAKANFIARLQAIV